MKHFQWILLVGLLLLPTTTVSQTFMTKTAILTWNANSESDLAGYKIYRGLDMCVANPAMSLVATVGKVTTYIDDKIPVSVTSTLGASTFRASTDFSGVQGQRGWTYIDSLNRPLTFVTAVNRWQGVDTYLRIWNTGIHPGDVSDAVRRWTAPSPGTIRITGNAILGSGGGGVIVTIRKGVVVLWQQTIAPSATGTYDVTTTVVSGDRIDFVINKGAGWDSFDATTFDPTISYTSGAPSGVIFTRSACYHITAYDISLNESTKSNNVDKVLKFAPGAPTAPSFR